MPFGLDIKSVIVGILIAMFVLPFVQSLIFAARPPHAPVRNN